MRCTRCWACCLSIDKIQKDTRYRWILPVVQTFPLSMECTTLIQGNWLFLPHKDRISFAPRYPWCRLCTPPGFCRRPNRSQQRPIPRKYLPRMFLPLQFDPIVVARTCLCPRPSEAILPDTRRTLWMRADSQTFRERTGSIRRNHHCWRTFPCRTAISFRFLLGKGNQACMQQ